MLDAREGGGTYPGHEKILVPIGRFPLRGRIAAFI